MKFIKNIFNLRKNFDESEKKESLSNIDKKEYNTNLTEYNNFSEEEIQILEEVGDENELLGRDETENFVKENTDISQYIENMETKDLIFQELNEEQRLAVKNIDGYVRVIAGAGSGKTKALVQRYIYLVKKIGISTDSILCVTFTNKAANEMKKRIRHLIGDYDLGLVCTFHGFCVHVLHDDIDAINFSKRFRILDNEDRADILKKVYNDNNISSSYMSIEKAKELMRELKVVRRYAEYIELMVSTNDMILKDRYEKSNENIDKIFYGYIYEQKKSYGLDFYDLILLTLHIFCTRKDILEKWQKRLEYVMVDEFQDIDCSQYELCRMISDYHKNLFVVGDPDQTIYTWRGANIKTILNFDKVFKDTKTVIMDKNYRSAGRIIDVSNSLIEKNKDRIDKNLISIKEIGNKVLYYHAKNITDEAKWIQENISRLLKTGAKYGDIAILYRAHFISRSIEEKLMENKIPYIIYSGISFYERKEIKDVLSYLRMITHGDDLSFLRVVNTPRRSIGEKRIAAIQKFSKENDCSLYEALKELVDEDLFINTKAKDFINLIESLKEKYKEQNIVDFMNELLDRSGYEEYLKLDGEEERINNVAELKQSIYEYESKAGEFFDLNDYLNKIALYTSMDKEQKKDTVKLLTVHSAKGLEFPYVFVCGMNEGIFPSRRANTIEQLEEERRLAYVAFTRAEKELYISEAEGFNSDGTVRYPSRFIFNIDKEKLEYCIELDENLVNSSKNFIEENEKNLLNPKVKKKESPIFKEGDYVEHEVFGKGKIIKIDDISRKYIIKFDDKETERSISMEINLKKIEE